MTAHPTDAFHYTGTENLEIMAEAERYNAFLTGLALGHFPANGRVLDFGAGTGTFAERIRTSGLDVECLEPDAGQAMALDARGFPTFTDSRDVPEARFDAIYSLNVMEHIEDHGAEARQLFRMLRPGGTAVIYVPAFQVLFGDMDRKVGHVRRYTRASLAQNFAEAGFVIEQNSYADSLGFLATLVFNAIDRGGDGTINPTALRLYDRLVFPLSRAIDRFVSGFFGKNVYVVLRKPLENLDPAQTNGIEA